MRFVWLWSLVACGGPGEVVDDKGVEPVEDSEILDTVDSDPDTVDTEVPVDSEPIDTDDGLVRLVVVDGARQWADGTLGDSCTAYRNPGDGYVYGGEDGNGAYRLSSSEIVLCEQESDGGGWTLVAQLRPSEDVGTNLCTPDAVGTLSTTEGLIAQPAKRSNAEIQALWERGTTREVLVKHDQDGWADGTRTEWDRVCRLDFVDDHVFSTATQSSRVEDLEIPQAVCTVGGDVTLATTNVNPFFCGWSYLSQSGVVLAFSSTVSYAGGNCGRANAGRSWFGEPNSGCNAQQVFVR